MELPEIVEKFGPSGIAAFAMSGMFIYMTRVRDHIREEKRIDDYHFSKVKEHINDAIEGLEERMLKRGLLILETVAKPNGTTCLASEGIDCTILQKERFEHDINKMFEQKFRGKIVGWMRENGFHEEDDRGVEKYIDMRLSQVIDILVPYIEKKARSRFIGIEGKVDEIVLSGEIRDFIKKSVEFSIEEQKRANEAIKAYRVAHGLLPEPLMKLLLKK